MIRYARSHVGMVITTDRRVSARSRPLGWWVSGAGRARYAGGVVLLIALYYAAAHVGYAFRFAGPVASIVWLPVGVAIAFLYFGGVQFWPGVLIGDLLVNNYLALPFPVAVGQTCGNILEAVVATLLLKQVARRSSLLDTLSGVMGMVCALAAGTAVSATIGSVALGLGGVISGGAVWGVWRTWWLGDFCGALLVVPLVLGWSAPVVSSWTRRRWLEMAVALIGVAALSALAMHTPRTLTPADQAPSTRVLGYLVLPGLIWTAVRLGKRGATLAVVVASGFAVWATTHYTGPFYDHSLASSVLETQLFIAAGALISLCLAAVVEEREKFARGLFASRARLVQAADLERRRLEHNLHDGAQQRLSALMVRLGLAAEAAGDQPAGTEALISAVRSEIGLTLEELRDLAHGSRPQKLLREGLAAAITEVAERSPIPIALGPFPSFRFPERAELTAYYVFVEAVANAQKHARASWLLLRAHVSRDFLHLEIADDGGGGAVESEGSGLQGLRDRVEALGGSFHVDSPVDGGTTITASIPTNMDFDEARVSAGSRPTTPVFLPDRSQKPA